MVWDDFVLVYFCYRRVLFNKCVSVIGVNVCVVIKGLKYKWL